MSDGLLLTGWGRTSPTRASELRPAGDIEALQDAVRRAGPRGVIGRGLGRSYGDAAQSAGGLVLDMTSLATIHGITAEGVLRCDAGASLHEVMRYALPRGWFVPVTPGTRFVTIGGALAADVHGKNHHRAGSMANHVLSIDMILPDGEIQRTGPGADSELYWATAGGMGLTGLVVAVELQMRPVRTAWMLADTERTSDLDATMSGLEAADSASPYSVAWIDCLAGGRRLGRGVITNGDHADPDELLGSGRAHDPLGFDPRSLVDIPPGLPGHLLGRLTVSAFNEVWYRRAPRRRVQVPQRIPSFFHPLDGVGNWNRIYGPHGMVQYQFAVPFEEDRAVRAAIEMTSSMRAPSFLAVLKRFGQASRGPLSFPIPGWTLALDIAADWPDLPELLRRLDDIVLRAAGRVYLAKDSRLEPSDLRAMYPRLEEFLSLRDLVDPEKRFSSDLSRRLSL